MGPKRKLAENKENDLTSSAKKTKSFDENSDDDVICLDAENEDIERVVANTTSNLTPQRLGDISNKFNVLAAKFPIGEQPKTQPIEASAKQVETTSSKPQKSLNFASNNVQTGKFFIELN